MFTPVFAVARTVGWVAQWNEMITDPETRLFRPRQLYTGRAKRDLVPIAGRATQAPLVGLRRSVRDAFNSLITDFCVPVR